MFIDTAQFVINQIYPYNTRLIRFCEQHSGAILKIQLSDVECDIAIYVHRNGLYLKNYNDEVCKASITTSLKDLIPYYLRGSSNLGMQTNGDIALLSSLESIIKDKPLSLSDWLHDHLGLTLGTLVYEGMETLGHAISDTYSHVKKDTRKYIQSAQKHLVTTETITHLKKAVQKLEYDIDRIEFRIQKLSTHQDD